MLRRRAPAADVARVTKDIIQEIKCEAGIANEIATDPSYAEKARAFRDVGAELDKGASTFPVAAKQFCKGDTDTATRREIGSLQASSKKLMNLFNGDDNSSLLSAIENVARSIQSLVDGAKSSAGE